MSWQEGVAVAIVLLGLGAGAFLLAQRPAFWIEFGSRLGKALLPLAWRYFEKDAAGGGSCMASGGEAGAGRGVEEKAAIEEEPDEQLNQKIAVTPNGIIPKLDRSCLRSCA